MADLQVAAFRFPGPALSAFTIAKLTAQAGQNLFFAALLVAAGTSDHAAAGLSSFFVAMLVASLAFGVPGGALADRIGPSRAFALGGLARAAVILAWALEPGHGLAVPAAVFAYSAVSQAYSPAEMALVRTLGRGRHGALHALLLALQFGGQGLAVAVLAPLLWWLGGTGALAAGGAAFALAAAAAACGLAVATSRMQLEVPARGSAFRDTVRFFRRHAIAREALIALALTSMVVQGSIVALPLYLRNDLAAGSLGAGAVISAAALGVAAGLLLAAFRLRPQEASGTMRAAVLAMAVGTFALAALDYGLRAALELTEFGPLVDLDLRLGASFAVAVPVAFLLGLAVCLALLAGRTALTAAAPAAHQSRVFAVQATLTDAFVVLPLVLFGVGVEVAGARPVLALMGGVAGFAFLVLEGRILVSWLQSPAEPAAVPVPVERD
ncbi:hypothetical protein [Tepidiforma thermophila]|uniref:MFS transporter n=1 Tax=Tepidiforma thermophila (strain KCTC 52669 / CGMCC 1.13589 / G233) TaxID=2761530 RepID=A0A2A9HED9_TEPT2|nr:hypothetical protein [Tepidiforma thermophila]PFG73365.1 hypothetical protein A9A59_0560 [Tepidiforma thermophila]